MSEQKTISSEHFAVFALDVGTFLLASGAHSGRVMSNLSRMALTWGFKIDLQSTFKGLLLTVQNLNDDNDVISMFKESPQHVIHLEVLTEISHLSWNVYENNLTIEETEAAFEKIKAMPSYNMWLVSLAIGISCAGLCSLSDGDIINSSIALVAAFIGSISRYKIDKMNFNSMISISVAAFLTTMITGLGTIFKLGNNPEAAMATSVLYLIPGVPLVNCIIDIIEGYLSSATNRALFAGFILLCIAVGMTLSITMLGISNFSL